MIHRRLLTVVSRRFVLAITLATGMRQTTNKLFLIGMPGSGKSTTALALSQRLGIPHMDTDQLIAAQQGKSVADIFRQHGEGYFRHLEATCIQMLCQRPQSMIVATGGGLPVYYNNLSRMLQSGLVVWLNTPLSLLLDRNLAQLESRPLFASATSAKDLHERLLTMMAARQWHYRQAYIATTDLVLITEHWHQFTTHGKTI